MDVHWAKASLDIGEGGTNPQNVDTLQPSTRDLDKIVGGGLSAKSG